MFSYLPGPLPSFGHPILSFMVMQEETVGAAADSFLCFW
jgi:hypothetical protein